MQDCRSSQIEVKSTLVHSHQLHAVYSTSTGGKITSNVNFDRYLDAALLQILQLRELGPGLLCLVRPLQPAAGHDAPARRALHAPLRLPGPAPPRAAVLLGVQRRLRRQERQLQPLEPQLRESQQWVGTVSFG